MIATHAVDADDCRLLCDVLGLDPTEARGEQTEPAGESALREGRLWFSGQGRCLPLAGRLC